MMLYCTAGIAQHAEEHEELAVKNEAGGYGKVITADGATDIRNLVDDKTHDTFSGKVKGTVTACCQNKGCWMRMDCGDGTSMMITFRDYGFFVPMDIPGKTVIVQGDAKMKTISVAEQKHYAEDVGKSQAEIDAITEPKRELVFVADGVLIE